MGTGRTFNKKPVSRPKKKLRERHRRVETQKKRLIALGHEEAKLTHMTPCALRAAIRQSEKAAARQPVPA